MKKKIKGILKKSIEKEWLDFDVDKIDVNYPKEEKFGDFSTNVAMILAGIVKKSPVEISKKIKDLLEDEINEIDEIEKIEIIAPGYINFYLSKKYFVEAIQSKILDKESDWGKIEVLNNKKYIFEHSSPNLFKPFHIGHLVNNSIGESLVRILRTSGAETKSLSFPSDISPGIAKTVWAIKNKGWSNEMTIEKIGEAYVWGVLKYKEDEKAKEEIDKINIKLYSDENFDGIQIFKNGQKISLEYFKKITARLGSEFESFIFESEAEKIGKKIVNKNIPSVFEKSEGAIIFPGSKYGLFDNVFINSQGYGTYLTKDIGLLKIKFDKFDFDKSITIADIEQKEHFQLVKKSAELINKEWVDKSSFIQHGRLSFSEGKISSRYGNVPLAEDLIESIKEKVFNKIKEHNIPEEEKDRIAEKIAIGALKYSILKSSTGKNIVFDFKKSILFEGDSGPYLQYSYVRANSILKNIEIIEDVEDVSIIPLVGKTILRFPEAIEMSLKSYSPHHLANFLYKLSSEFNSFYAHTKVLNKKNLDYKYNIALTKSVAITLKKGLYLLGIKTMDRM